MFICLSILHFEGWAQDCGNSNIFLKPLFRGNLDPFVNNANLGAIARIKIFIVYRKKCCNLHNTFMVRRLGLGKNNHLTYASLALNPQFVHLYVNPYFISVQYIAQCIMPFINLW